MSQRMRLMWIPNQQWRWMRTAATLVLICWIIPQVAPAQDLGTWELLLENAGIACMHAALTRFGTVVMIDRTDIGASQIGLPAGVCRDSDDLVLKHDCTAHSVVFDPVTKTVRPLFLQTDPWCSSGQFMPDGSLMQTGGDFDGVRKIRTFVPCEASGICDWVESTTQELQSGRWYSTNQLLPDGRQIIIGGRSAFNLEFIPPNANGPLYFPFLNATNDDQNDNLYPYVHLLPSGNLFVFANRDSIEYNYLTDTVVRTFPRIPGEPRNYPSGGSSVMLPLLASNNFSIVEILVCGGAQYGAYLNSAAQMTCSNTCGRMVVSDPNPTWAMDDIMPIPRCMGDMILLPTRDVMIINGAQQGSQGWTNAINPAFSPVLYYTYASPGYRMLTMAPTTIARMYHSTANLMQDGRIFIAGSNPHQFYVFDVDYPTELRLEAFSPHYLAPSHDLQRPTVTVSPLQITYNTPFTVTVSAPVTLAGPPEINLVSAPFSTHSYQQGQRVVSLAVSSSVQIALATLYQITAVAPWGPTLAPPGYYMLFAVNEAVPSTAVWVLLST
ncbi:aldehyde oxidase GLOX isoform X3 [Physcomitrium patens]|uniref:Galactose oxidase-like Early set domain-containing protein n=3 Tax=Physcomitrium patens TaxID=3218 RepID=A0A2K1K3F7_PHYPA|nr:aldehyde oxidase GLOX-like isoform X3 [Physcomitrium patens]XP_024385533.1 aldehyde oxidase GLOX-like isoform X3 [Physcomitrium patens]XP_024385534.1 aldehyde oxidase GLOX-like isoform X3 [Physcomitrium patens]PNR48312.1 hypothetical protein PHYPA_012788 [Physcomitrium patens]|eukprot:XP_024385531.1 aldehyde oxidase GLOX-like isoform X3 [Physcomitrella patens]